MNNERKIEETVALVVKALAEAPREPSGEAWMSGDQLREITNLSPGEINDAVTILKEEGLVETHEHYGITPFNFAVAALTARGRLEFERVMKEKGIEPIPSLEEVISSGLRELGYKLLESNVVTPSGSSIDFIMQHEGQPIGVEVRARNVEPDDLKGTIDTRSKLGLRNIMVVSNKGFEKDTKKFAEKHNIPLVTIDNILRKMDEARLPTTMFERNIQNLMNFTKSRAKLQRSLLEEFKIALAKTTAAKTNKEKKDSLEKLGEILINMIEGLEVIKKNVNTKTEEIDLTVKNESKDPFWQRLPTPFLVECKNWSKPVGASEIRNFDGKMNEITFRIMIAINGITGRSERDDAKGAVRDARKQGRQIVILDKKDLIDIAKGVHPAEKINAKFYELYKL